MENNLPKITYIFGAGASAQVLPTIKGMPDRIKFVKNFIEVNYKYKDDDIVQVTKDIKINKLEAKNYLLQGLNELYVFSNNHSTIDTYAKKLYISRRSNEIDRLCFFLALYFNLEQKIVGVDPRYDTFLISILDSSLYKFPKNLKFLTWNYDLQFELAYKKLTERNDDIIDFETFNHAFDRSSKEEFSSFKINGSCNVTDRHSFYPMIKGISNSNCQEEDLDFALSYSFTNIKNRTRTYDCSNNIKFSWYQDNDFLENVTEFHNETEILVVIGYSFPFFNREVDRKIIRGMKNLKKIYIQDCFPNNIKTRFLSILPDWEKAGIQIIPVDDVSEFFLPPEL